MIYHDGCDDLEGLATTVRKTVKALKPYRASFDSIVCSGMSGVVVGVPVALGLKCPVVIVRKREPLRRVAVVVVNGKQIGERALFLDDFRATGDTKRYVADKVSQGRTRVIGHYYYRDHAFIEYEEGVQE